jgi:[ribosomal protein S5]-alanine N-acetyltransferase
MGNVREGPSMLNGDKVVLRPVRERDLAAFIDAHTEISNRGEFFPLGVQPEPVLRRHYAETGFWERDEGTLLIWNRDDVMVGHIEFFRPVSYWDAYELSYQLYGQEHAGQGYTTEAVRLLVDYLFGAKKVNRISLVVVPENAPSRRIAEKCGFQLEGTARGAFFNGGRSVDVLIYSLLRDDPRPWRKPD